MTRARSGGFRLSVTESFSPIGKLHSFGGARINGRQTDGEQAVWAGDMIEAPPNSSIRVSLNSIGRITLKESAIARLATSYEMADQNADRRVLVAWVLKGDMAAQLDADVSAYVEARGLTFSSSAGASFRITSREGLVVAEAAIGAISAVASLQPEYTLERIDYDPTSGTIEPARSEIKKRRRQPKRVYARLTKKRGTRTVSFTSGPATGATQQDSDPVPGETMEFELISDNPNIILGTLSTNKEQTDRLGIASTMFLAGNNSGTGKLRATVLRLGLTVEWKVIVTAGPGLTRLVLIGAAVIGTIILWPPPFGDEEIKQVPPPVIP